MFRQFSDKQTYAIMPDNPHEQGQIPVKVIHELVAFRYSDEVSVMLVGEAELMIEVLMGFGDETETITNLHCVRVDILSAFDPEGRDVFAETVSDPALKAELEKTVLEHYFHPPKVPVGLPKRVTEW